MTLWSGERGREEVNINNDNGNYVDNNDDNNSKTQLFCFLIGVN